MVNTSPKYLTEYFFVTLLLFLGHCNLVERLPEPLAENLSLLTCFDRTIRSRDNSSSFLPASALAEVVFIVACESNCAVFETHAIATKAGSHSLMSHEFICQILRLRCCCLKLLAQIRFSILMSMFTLFGFLLDSLVLQNLHIRI